MFCMKCEKDLVDCTCPDLKEQLASIADCKYLLISPEKMEKYKAQAKRNKEEKTIEE